MRTRPTSLWLSIGWWLAFVLLGPLLWVQGRWARWRTPRLPPLAGPLMGTAGEGVGGETTLHLLVFGESPAAGVGVATHEESLPARLAAELARRQRLHVTWRSVAENGANLRRVLDTQLPQLASASPGLVLVVLGVNDTTGLTRRTLWRSQLAELIVGIRARSDCPILFTSVPRMDSFTALPQPLRSALGMRGRLLDNDLRDIASAHVGVHRGMELPLLSAQQLAADGYHPSAIACLDWAVQLADCLPPLPDRTRAC
jgi:lysophospholipase L1-like esterase